MHYAKKRRDLICNQILKDIESGLSLRQAVGKIPISRNTFNNWLHEDKKLQDQYARAREMREELIFDEILQIADQTEYDTIFNEAGKMLPDNEWIQRSKLRIDSRKWILSKMNPKKYGDKTDITSDGERINIINLGPGIPPDNGAND